MTGTSIIQTLQQKPQGVQKQKQKTLSIVFMIIEISLVIKLKN